MCPPPSGPALSARPTAVRTVAALLIAASLVALVGCAGSGRDEPAAVAQAAGAPELQGFLDTMLRPASEREAETLLAGLPAPQTADAVRVRSRHDPRQANTVRTLYFEGLELLVYEVGGTEVRFPVGAVVTGARYVTREGLRTGLSTVEVRAILGEPARATPEHWTYEIVDDPSSAPYELLLEFTRGTVVRLEWRAYLD